MLYEFRTDTLVIVGYYWISSTHMLLLLSRLLFEIHSDFVLWEDLIWMKHMQNKKSGRMGCWLIFVCMSETCVCNVHFMILNHANFFHALFINLHLWNCSLMATIAVVFICKTVKMWNYMNFICWGRSCVRICDAWLVIENFWLCLYLDPRVLCLFKGRACFRFITQLD